MFKTKSFYSIKNLYLNFKKISFLFDIITYIKSKQELKLIEKKLFSRKEQQLLSKLFIFEYDFVNEETAYEKFLRK